MSAPIRVAHLVGSTGLYGAERWILALLRYLPPDRVQASVVNLVDEPGAASVVVQAARELGMPAFDLYTGGRFNPAGIARLASLTRGVPYDILHGHGYKADVLALLASKLTGVPVVSTPHGWSQASDRRLALYEWVGRLGLRFVEYVCPLSPALRDDLKRRGVPDRKLRLILNGVDLAEVDGVALAAGRCHGETIVGYVGQLIPRKNVECLVRAVARLAAGRDDLRLTIVGDGPLSGALQDLAARSGLSGRVRFTGYRVDRIAILKGFDVLVLPSWEEGIPRCVMEAMAAGVPVIASDIPGNRTLVTHGETGLLFPPGDPERLAAAMVTMIERSDARAEMTRRARAVVERQFSAGRMAEEYSRLYESCLTSSS